MKRGPLKSHVYSAFLLAFVFSTISVCMKSVEADPTKVRRNHKNSSSSGSSEIFMFSGTNSKQKILVDVGDTVYIGCPLNKTNANGCEWYKKNSKGGSRKRITQFFGRYQRITPCQLQIKSVQYEDAGTIICRVSTDSENSNHTSQLTVTGQDDPFENILPKISSENSKSSFPPYSEPEITRNSSSDAMQPDKGKNILLKCEATGNPKPLVSWIRDNKNCTLPAEGYSHLKLTNLTKGDSGSYKCEAVNIFGRAVHEVKLEVKDVLRGSAEILEVVPRNLSLYEGNQGNVTCTARFEGDPWFGWVKKIENKTGENNGFYYEGQYYSVLQRPDIRRVGRQRYSTTLFLQNVTTGNSGVYHCIVAGLQGYNYSEAIHIFIEKDPSKLHMAQIRKHKAVAILWILSFVIFAGLVILCIVRICGCPNTVNNKKNTQGTLSSDSSTKKTQLPKRSPETLSTDCTHPRHEVFAPLVTHGSCSLASQEPSVPFKDCNSSCRTYNSFDPEFSIPSSADSYIMADLEAARSSYSHVESCDLEYCSQQSFTSPRSQTSDYQPRTQQKTAHTYRDSHRNHHKHRHQYQHLYHKVASENQASYFPSVHQTPYSPRCTQECCNCHHVMYDSSNLSLSSDCDSQWYSEQASLPPEDQSFIYEDEDQSRISSNRRKLNPSPNLSFLERLRTNPNTVTAVL